MIKHAHHDFDVDTPGKDSYELRKAGAAQMLISSRRRWALMVERPADREPPLDEVLLELDQELLDLILVEGFKHERFPKIELHRPSFGRPLLHPPRRHHRRARDRRAARHFRVAAHAGPELARRNRELRHRHDAERSDLTLPRHRENVPRMSLPEPLPDCYEGDPDLLPPGEAMRRIRAHVRPLDATETIAVIDALGRVAARDVVSPRNVPGHTNSAMDGFACAGDSLPESSSALGTRSRGRHTRASRSPAGPGRRRRCGS